MRRRSLLAATVLTAASLTGCSSAASTPAADTSPTASTPPADGGTYTSADAILARLTALGLACGSPQPVADATAPGATSMVDCDSPAGGGSDTVVVVFDSSADAQAYAERMANSGLGPAQVVYGEDWAVNTVPPYGEQVRGALGGGMLTGAAASAS